MRSLSAGGQLEGRPFVFSARVLRTILWYHTLSVKVFGSLVFKSR